ENLTKWVLCSVREERKTLRRRVVSTPRRGAQCSIGERPLVSPSIPSRHFQQAARLSGRAGPQDQPIDGFPKQVTRPGPLAPNQTVSQPSADYLENNPAFA